MRGRPYDSRESEDNFGDNPVKATEAIKEEKVDKLEFSIKVTYFKSSGKYYTEDEFKRKFRYVGDKNNPTCYMNDVTAYIRGLRQCDGQGSLPGLASTGGWDGFILVECDKGVPCLIIPSDK